MIKRGTRFNEKRTKSFSQEFLQKKNLLMNWRSKEKHGGFSSYTLIFEKIRQKRSLKISVLIPLIKEHYTSNKQNKIYLYFSLYIFYVY